MHHPRRLRLRRLLFLVPLALLVAALFMRARLPRPQTEGDKWLWEQGEGAAFVDVVPNAYAEQRAKRLKAIHASKSKFSFFSGGNALWCQHTRVKDRACVRSLFRAFQGTHFSPGSPPTALMLDFNENAGLDIALVLPPLGIPGSVGPGGHEHRVRLYQNGKHFYLWRSDGMQSPVNTASVARFQGVFALARLKAWQQQAGYTTFPDSCPDL